MNDVTTDLFPSELLFGEGGGGVSDIVDKTQTHSSTPPNGSVSSESPTPLSRQHSLEYEVPKRSAQSAGASRRSKKVARSRTYSQNELTTKFRVPKEPKCVETADGDILMDKTTFLHFMNEVKLVKTSLLKLKRTLVEVGFFLYEVRIAMNLDILKSIFAKKRPNLSAKYAFLNSNSNF